MAFNIGDRVQVRYAPESDKRFSTVEGLVIETPCDFEAWWGKREGHICVESKTHGIFGVKLGHPSVYIKLAPETLSPYQAMYEYTVEHGGGTFQPLHDFAPLPVGPGYIVGGVAGVLSETVKGPEGIQAFAEKYAALLQSQRHGYYLGTWEPDDNGIVLDVVQLFQHRISALIAGRQRGEYAIWDNGNSIEILTGYDKGE